MNSKLYNVIETAKLQVRGVRMINTSLTVSQMRNTISWLQLACRADRKSQPELSRLIKVAGVMCQAMAYNLEHKL